MLTAENYIYRCFDLAVKAAGEVTPNPMVGAVIVYKDNIIGEGYHQRYGGDHAEVMAIKSIKPDDLPYLPYSKLYVSLEPCCIYGKTPPCTDLILKHHIPEVIVSVCDATPEVNGKGLEILQNAGVKVTHSILSKEGHYLARFRASFVLQKRPYIFLKFAQTADKKMGSPKGPVAISNAYTQRLSHRWRGEYGAVLTGYRTALIDNPNLTNRYYFGKSPLRIVLDKDLNLPDHLNIFKPTAPTTLIHAPDAPKRSFPPSINLVAIPFDGNFWPRVMDHLFLKGINSLMVEGGARVISQLLELGLWDEMCIFEALAPGDDLTVLAPSIYESPAKEMRLDNNRVLTYFNPQTSHLLNLI